MRKIVIDPRVIKHLGRDLITSPEVAVIELIKNSIDAKASHINLRLYNSMSSNELIPDCVGDSIPNEYLASPILVVEDDGCGMTDATIDGGFLKIATDIKSNEESTLGEKGIGRLAAQRLGTALLVETSSDKENHTSYIFIDWNAVINGVVDIPSCDGPNTLHHTRLFIFNANLEDYIDNATQFKQVSLDTTAFQVQVNRELKSALNFLITPFADAQDTLFIPQIKFYFDEHEVDITFPYDTLALAESIHNFRFEPTEDGMLNYGLNIKPWFIERVHRALVKAEAFKRLKKPHSFYRDILERNSTRIENTLKATATKDELVSLFYNILCDFYAVAEDEDKKLIFDSFIEKKALSAIEELLKIAPITGSIYSFKQGAAIGDKIIIDAAYDLGETSKRYSLKELKYFLEDYNGIKLYRDIFRIGFLGNKESDWIKLQQFRTKGQQWYRFDLGNTVGYVSLADAGQNHIQEISSRLDISGNETSEAFKLLINVVFNYLFYDLNRKANDLVKTLLAEEGLLEENLSKRVKKNDTALREMMRRNKRMQKALADVSEHLRRGTQISGTDQVALPQQSYAFLTDTVRKLDADSGVEWIGEIPKHWSVIPSKFLFANCDERRREGDVQLTASQKYGMISQEEYMRRENARIVLADKGLENWKHVEPFDFVISLRSFQGGLEMSEVTGCATWHYIILRARQRIHPYYYKWLFKSSMYITTLQRTCNYIRDGQDLRYSNFVKVPLCIPTLYEQQKIADFLDRKCAKIDHLITLKQSKIEKLEQYKRSLIYEYVTGKREVI